MKTSRRLLFGTFVVLLATPVVLVGYGRFSGAAYQEVPPPERSAPEALAALRDFTAIDISGDFSLAIVRGDSYAVSYEPIAENRGNFTAVVRDGVLEVEGFGNRTEFAMATVSITLPSLDALEIGYVPEVTVSNFEGDSLEADITFVESIVFENNRYGAVEFDLQRAGIADFRGNTFGSSTIRHFGTTITTD
jgi:hypothetical protein